MTLIVLCTAAGLEAAVYDKVAVGHMHLPSMAPAQKQDIFLEHVLHCRLVKEDAVMKLQYVSMSLVYWSTIHF